MHKRKGAANTPDFRIVIDALPGLIWTTSADGACDFVNRAWNAYTGIATHRAAGRGWQAAIHPEDLSPMLQIWSDIRQTETAKEIYIRLRRADGEYRWYTLSPSLCARGSDGAEQWCWLAMNADEGPVTDGRLRRLFDMLPLQAAFLNQQGTSEFSNRQTLDDYNMTLEELAAWQTSGAIHKDDHPIVYHQLERLMKTGEMFDATLRMRYKDGTYRWMRCRCVPCRDAQGNIARYVTVQSDVHDLKHAEDMLAAEVKLMELVARGEPLQSILDAVSRNIEALCPGCFCGVLLVATGGAHFQLDASNDTHDAFRQIIADAIAVDQSPWASAVIEKRFIVCADLVGDPRWRASRWTGVARSLGYASCWSMPIVSGFGEICGVVSTYQHEAGPPTAQVEEVIDRFAKIAGIAIARARGDEALSHARSELAYVARVATLNAMTASIAHEVNQPLAGILTNASTCVRMLAAEPPNLTGAVETAKRTIRDANRASEVIARLRAMFSRKSPTVETLDLKDIATEVLALSRSELQRNRVVVETEFAPGLTAVACDRVQLQQVLLNLILNASDAMSAIDERPRTLLIRTTAIGSEEVQLSVRDTGPGIDPAASEKLFDAFYTTKPHGMGVGLSISRSIIENHGGRLWVDRNDGPGATFSFRIPAKHGVSE